jgi:uncharacterized protein (UPF0276 family)
MRGLGLRGEFIQLLCEQPKIEQIDFLEIAPENWIDVGGLRKEQLAVIASKYPLVAHGLSLSVAGYHPLDIQFIEKIARFLDEYGITLYSEHLSFVRDSKGYLYELLPPPRFKENVSHIAQRIKIVQETIGRKLVLENISYYHQYPGEMDDTSFLSAIVQESGCGILLDINNVYVNAVNHCRCPYETINALPTWAISYYHIAGHRQVGDSQLIDTHGQPLSEEVIALAAAAIARHGKRPMVLERDNNVPPFTQLLDEMMSIHDRLMTETT